MISIESTYIDPSARFNLIANAEIRRRGFRASLEDSVLGRLLLDIFYLCCCSCLCEGAEDIELKEHRIYLLRNRCYPGDQNYDAWASAVKKVNRHFGTFYRIDWMANRTLHTSHSSQYSNSPNPRLNVQSSYQPTNNNQWRQTAPAVNYSSSYQPTIATNSRPTSVMPLVFNTASSFRSNASSNSRPFSVSNTPAFTQPSLFVGPPPSNFGSPQFSANNRPGSVPFGTKKN